MTPLPAFNELATDIEFSVRGQLPDCLIHVSLWHFSRRQEMGEDNTVLLSNIWGHEPP
jgi:hypothetical protein